MILMLLVLSGRHDEQRLGLWSITVIGVYALAPTKHRLRMRLQDRRSRYSLGARLQYEYQNKKRRKESRNNLFHQ